MCSRFLEIIVLLWIQLCVYECVFGCRCGLICEISMCVMVVCRVLISVWFVVGICNEMIFSFCCYCFVICVCVLVIFSVCGVQFLVCGNIIVIFWFWLGFSLIVYSSVLDVMLVLFFIVVLVGYLLEVRCIVLSLLLNVLVKCVFGICNGQMCGLLLMCISCLFIFSVLM